MQTTTRERPFHSPVEVDGVEPPGSKQDCELGGAVSDPNSRLSNFNSRVAKYLTRWEMGNGKWEMRIHR
jgi:hypothetical protein